MRVKSARKRVKEALASPEARVGAARALERLEAEEAALYCAYKSARASGDVLSAKLSRDSWLKVSESLRKYDLMVVASRRGEGELVPRKAVEAWLGNLASWLHFALRDVTGDGGTAFKKVTMALRGYVGNSNDKAAPHGAPVPAWALRALQAEGVWREPAEQLLAWRRLYHVDLAAQLFPNDPKKFSEHVASAMARDTAELKGQDL